MLGLIRVAVCVFWKGWLNLPASIENCLFQHKVVPGTNNAVHFSVQCWSAFYYWKCFSLLQLFTTAIKAVSADGMCVPAVLQPIRIVISVYSNLYIVLCPLAQSYGHAELLALVFWQRSVLYSGHKSQRDIDHSWAATATMHQRLVKEQGAGGR